MNEVDALHTREELAQVSALLTKHGGQLYADIWNLGLNVALRISDMLKLRMAEVVRVERLILTEQKTGKRREVPLNARAREIIARRAAEHPGDEWLFQATANRARSTGQPIRRETVARKFAEVGDILGINLGTHSMRKSRGAAMFAAGVPLEVITKTLNHSSPAVTLRYIGVDRARVNQTYDDFVL